MRRTVLLFCLAALGLQAAERRAKNVILFIADAGGTSTVNAASWYKYGEPQRLFIQKMPNIALMDTSAADAIVTDSAAGMSAIVTGQKTNNGVLSQSAAAVRGKKDGEILKTILEYAEERGLSTGVMSNMNMTDATPAACYAHVNNRSMAGEIFAQVLKPRFGDGVDLIIGRGRDVIYKATEGLNIKIEPALKEKGYAIRDSIDAISPNDRRVVALFNTGDFDVWQGIQKAVSILSKNPKGYFLMVEWDTHTDNIRAGLQHMIEMDSAVRQTSELVKKDTLIIFAADHSFDIRVRGGKRGEPFIPPDVPEKELKTVRMEGSHTGEEVLAAAMGPGAQRVRGYIANTDLFRIMLAAYGWTEGKR